MPVAEDNLELSDMLIAAHGEAQRSGTGVIEQLNVTFSKRDCLIAERYLDPLLDLRDQRSGQ